MSPQFSSSAQIITLNYQKLSLVHDHDPHTGTFLGIRRNHCHINFFMSVKKEPKTEPNQKFQLQLLPKKRMTAAG